MFEEADRDTGIALFFVIALAIVVALGTIGIATGTAIGLSQKPATASRGPVTMMAASDSSRAQLYFELGSAALPPDALTRLAPLVLAAKGEARFAVSGFHDASGDASANAELAKQRAFAVRDLLVTAGVPAERIVLEKPALAMGGADPREARRVEVTVR